ncbi:PspA/IM30 family protein [Paenibacillus glucanolyticus]|uniref:PspA/IM30 family protein n=1 Tax=Paenibacillus glucanolyticus TaxID=59843 RepID=UPI003D02113A
MGIFGRMKDIAAADVHRLLDNVEDPVTMAKYYIRQLDEQIDKARSALEVQIAAEQQYDVLIARTGQVIDKRARQAELAVARSQDEIAKLAIQEKLHHMKLHQTYVEQRETIQKQISALRGEIDRLLDLRRELNDKLTFLIARVNAAVALRATARAVPATDASKITRGFEYMEQKIMRLEAGTLAYQSAGHTASRLSDWSEQDEVQAELDKLKAAKPIS